MSIGYALEGSVAVITIDRPQRRNAVDAATARELSGAWDRFEREAEALVGVLHGAGGHFSAGADLVAFDLVDGDDGPLGFTRRHVAKPTIAAVEGYCVGGGLEMALWCDLRVAGEGAVLGCFERRFGVPLIDGGTQRLPALIGLGRALDLILTGRPVSAGEALEIGLINRVVPVGTALSSALELARQLAALPQAALRSDRQAVYAGLNLPPGLAAERELGRTSLEEAAEGAARFASGEGRHGVPSRD